MWARTCLRVQLTDKIPQSDLQACLCAHQLTSLELDSQGKVARNYSQIFRSIAGHELQLALRVPLCNRLNSEGVQKCSFCRTGAHNLAIHRLLRRFSRRKQLDPVSEFQLDKKICRPRFRTSR